MRTPAEIIGHDAYKQLIFEGYDILPTSQVSDLKECVEASIEGPRKDRKLISPRVGEMVPMPTFILKGQVKKAIRLLKDLSN